MIPLEFMKSNENHDLWTLSIQSFVVPSLLESLLFFTKRIIGSEEDDDQKGRRCIRGLKKAIIEFAEKRGGEDYTSEWRSLLWFIVRNPMMRMMLLLLVDSNAAGTIMMIIGEKGR